jgi:hypothetical protein
MKTRGRSPRTHSSWAVLPTLAITKLKPLFAPATMLFVGLACFAQQQPSAPEPQNAEPPVAMEPESATPPNNTAEKEAATTVTVPAGTRFALVLTHSIQTRYIHRGDDIYAQITSPITSGSEVVIPPGTLVQGKVDKLARKGGRGELYLQSLEAVFPDGYVVPISGPTVLETDDGYALKDPGPGRETGAFALPLAGAGLGALVGHSAASSQGTTVTSTLPPGCTGPPPGCLTSSVTGPPDKGKDTVIGAAIGGAIGGVASLVLLFSSHNFFLDVGSPVEMVLQQPLTLPQDQVDDAVRQSAEHPQPTQPVYPRPMISPPPPNTDTGICYTPGTPGTPDTVIPGVPGPDGIPGPPTIIPGTPPTPPTPYPCP